MQQLNCIMLVDDDEITNFINESMIEEMEVSDKILTALNGKEALEVLKKEELQNQRCPELILLDINMPVMNGFEFLEAYQQWDDPLKQDIIIVMLTSSRNPKDVQRVEHLGGSEILNKPLNKEKLLEVLNKYFPNGQAK